MKERPILFNTEMVRPILDRRKNQTRRAIKPQPLKYFPEAATGKYQEPKWFSFIYPTRYQSDTFGFIKCPYGKVGDRLWVRENIRTLCYQGRTDFEYGAFLIEYRADEKIIRCPDEYEKWWRRNWHIRPSTTIPSIHMPKWVARIWLEITNIRVERVQEISEEDCLTEGILLEGIELGDGTYTDNPYEQFAQLWDSINAKPKPVMKNSRLARLLLDNDTLNRLIGNVACYVSYPWEDVQETREHRGKKWFVCGNPYIWVIEFKRVSES